MFDFPPLDSGPRGLASCLPLILAVWLVAPMLPGVAFAQPASAPHVLEPIEYRSAISENRGELPAVTLVETFAAPPETPWMRIHFGEVQLGERSFLTVTSLADGYRQRIDRRALELWSHKSAYFNGDSIEIELHAMPGDSGLFFAVQGMTVGLHASEVKATKESSLRRALPKSQCGATDDRQLTDDPAVGRVMPVGCTGWIVSNRANLTAGHCIGASSDSLHFNVPASLPDGTVQHPPPEDQYPIEAVANIDFRNGGSGDDWAVFETFENPETGLHAVVAQGAFYRMTRDLNLTTVDNVRVTGYGLDFDDPERSQVLQTHLGPWVQEFVQAADDVIIEYQVDTEGGNSGSPVIVDGPATGFPPLTMGIHTHGGCDADGGNLGTGFENDDLQTAVHDFAGPSVVYVDENHFDTTPETGTVLRPFDTVKEGVSSAASLGGTPILSIVKGNYDETFTGTDQISEPMILQAPVGPVIIGSN